MNKSEKEIHKIMKNIDVICPDKKQLASYERALNDFNRLIENGITKSRGYNLQTVEECRFVMDLNVGL